MNTEKSPRVLDIKLFDLFKEILLLIIMIYLVIIGGTYNGMVLYTLQLTNLVLAGCLGVAGGIWLIWQVHRNRLTLKTPLDLALMIWLGVVALACIFSTNPRLSWEIFVQSLVLVLFFYLVVVLIRTGWPEDLLEALTAAGRTDLAYAIAVQQTYPSWGHMLAGGATTLWERWEHATGSGMNSHNHPMLGSVGAWFYRALAGIRAHPAGAGFSRFSVRPEIVADLDYVRASLKTVRGLVGVEWKRDGEDLAVIVEVPAGSTARVALPCEGWGRISEGEQPVWQDETPQTLFEGIHTITREGDRVVIEIGSGRYQFLSKI